MHRSFGSLPDRDHQFPLIFDSYPEKCFFWLTLPYCYCYSYYFYFYSYFIKDITLKIFDHLFYIFFPFIPLTMKFYSFLLFMLANVFLNGLSWVFVVAPYRFSFTSSRSWWIGGSEFTSPSSICSALFFLGFMLFYGVSSC